MIVLEHDNSSGRRRDFGVLLDRDGTVLEETSDYVRQPEDIQLVPDLTAAALDFSRADVSIALVSNQSAIGRGIVARDRVIELHLRVVDQLAAAGMPVCLSILCPHAPADGCTCRKPSPGMVQEAGRLLAVPPSRTFLVGDAARDIEAAWSAGVRPFLVLTGQGRQADVRLAASRRELDVVDNIAVAAARIREDVVARRSDRHAG